VSTGDNYLKSFLVGSGSMASPASGSLLASNVFTNANYRTLLYLWWDECGGSNGSCDANNASPNLLYGTPVKKGYVSPDLTGIDEYAAVRTIESNWGLSPLAQGTLQLPLETTYSMTSLEQSLLLHYRQASPIYQLRR